MLSQSYIKAASNSRIGEAGVIEYTGTFISQRGTAGVSLLTSSSMSYQAQIPREINKLDFSKNSLVSILKNKCVVNNRDYQHAFSTSG